MRFLSLPWLAVALAGSALARRLAPAAAPPAGRFAAAIAGGVVAACALAAAGVIPWTAPLHLTAYAAMLILAVLAAVAAARPRLAARGIDRRHAVDLAVIALAAGLVGSRALFVAQNWRAFTRGPDGAPLPAAEAFAAAADLDAGGMVWYGGVILATPILLAVAWRRRWPLLPLFDALVPPGLLALAIGRVGCFLNGCCYGAPCDLPWAVTNPHLPGVRVHPTQLYETVACLALAGALSLPGPRPAGLVTGLGCLGYGCWRFVNEGLRGDHHPGVWTSFYGLFPATFSQVASLHLAAAGAGLAWWAWRRRRPVAPPGPTDPTGR